MPAKGSFTYDDLKQYTQEVKPFLAKNIWWDADMQVKHWMKVVKEWKDMLGQDWEKTYGVTNSLYVTRQNNILYSVLAQFFGKEALNTRLFLFETSLKVFLPPLVPFHSNEWPWKTDPSQGEGPATIEQIK